MDGTDAFCLFLRQFTTFFAALERVNGIGAHLRTKKQTRRKAGLWIESGQMAMGILSSKGAGV